MDFLRFIRHTSVDISLKIVVEWKVGIVRMKGIKTGSLTGGEVVGEVGGMSEGRGVLRQRHVPSVRYPCDLDKWME